MNKRKTIGYGLQVYIKPKNKKEDELIKEIFNSNLQNILDDLQVYITGPDITEFKCGILTIHSPEKEKSDKDN